MDLPYNLPPKGTKATIFLEHQNFQTNGFKSMAFVVIQIAKNDESSIHLPPRNINPCLRKKYLGEVSFLPTCVWTSTFWSFLRTKKSTKMWWCSLQMFFCINIISFRLIPPKKMGSIWTGHPLMSPSRCCEQEPLGTLTIPSKPKTARRNPGNRVASNPKTRTVLVSWRL